MQRVLALIILSALFSCTRTVTPTPPVPPATTSSLSITEYKPHVQKLVTDLTYDADQWPATIRIHSFDTLGGIGYRDTALITFQRSNSANPPESYDINWLIGTSPPDFGATEHHLLYYDNQSRIIKDSTSQTTGLDLASTVFIYNGNLITIQKYSYAAQVPGSWLMYEQDTLNLASGNIGGYIGYYLGNGTSPIFTELDSYMSSDAGNPLYQPSVANSLGALFRSDFIGYNYIGDFISPKLMSQWGYTPSQNQALTQLDYAWTTDTQGRVVQGSGTDVNGGGPADIFTFQYQQD
jgi:hypothetical protein